MIYSASSKRYGPDEYQVLDHNGYDPIGEYVTESEAQAIVKRYNAIIMDYSSAVIQLAYKLTSTPTFDRMREQQLNDFSSMMIAQSNLADMEYCLLNRMHLAEDVQDELYEQDYL